MQFNFIGCGDAFGSGGRFNTCFHVTGDKANLLIDCGATSLVALKRAGIGLNEIRTILITHFHADHFGGIPPLVLAAQFSSRRIGPLAIVGPVGLEARFQQAMETAYAGSSGIPLRFDLECIEIAGNSTTEHDGMRISAFPVDHGDPGGTLSRIPGGSRGQDHRLFRRYPVDGKPRRCRSQRRPLCVRGLLPG